jgi:pterin-4a-carbinolamine dehydratase
MYVYIRINPGLSNLDIDLANKMDELSKTAE